MSKKTASNKVNNKINATTKETDNAKKLFSQNNTYLIFGAGITGQSAVMFCQRHGLPFYITDDNKETLKTLKVNDVDVNEDNKLYDYSEATLKAKQINYIILSPHIKTQKDKHKIVEIAKNIGAEIISDVDLFYSYLTQYNEKNKTEKKLIGITGTNGKSTTTALVAHILNENDKPAVACGNIGVNPLSFTEEEVRKYDYFVVEMSSYNLVISKYVNFDVGGLINFSPDHLDYHGTMEEYIKAKMKIFDLSVRKVAYRVDDDLAPGINDKCREDRKVIDEIVYRFLTSSTNIETNYYDSNYIYDNNNVMKLAMIELLQDLPNVTMQERYARRRRDIITFFDGFRCVIEGFYEMQTKIDEKMLRKKPNSCNKPDERNYYDENGIANNLMLVPLVAQTVDNAKKQSKDIRDFYNFICNEEECNEEDKKKYIILVAGIDIWDYKNDFNNRVKDASNLLFNHQVSKFLYKFASEYAIHTGQQRNRYECWKFEKIEEKEEFKNIDDNHFLKKMYFKIKNKQNCYFAFDFFGERKIVYFDFSINPNVNFSIRNVDEEGNDVPNSSRAGKLDSFTMFLFCIANYMSILVHFCGIAKIFEDPWKGKTPEQKQQIMNGLMKECFGIGEWARYFSSVGYFCQEGINSITSYGRIRFDWLINPNWLFVGCWDYNEGDKIYTNTLFYHTIDKKYYFVNKNNTLFDGEFHNLKGPHNIQNIVVAVGITNFCGVDFKQAFEAVKTFQGLEHRLQLIKTIEGIEFVNDSKGTNANSTEQALKAYKDYDVYLIAGGQRKEDGFLALKPYLACVKCVFLIGEATESFAKELDELSITYVKCGTMDVAVKKAFEMAQNNSHNNKKRVVLLSPLCASFDQYKSFEERGDDFCKIVDSIANVKIDIEK